MGHIMKNEYDNMGHVMTQHEQVVIITWMEIVHKHINLPRSCVFIIYSYNLPYTMLAPK
jgi:hypothetical protein